MLLEDFGLGSVGAFGFGIIEVGFACDDLGLGTDVGLGDGVDRPASANLLGGLSGRLCREPMV